MTDSGDHGGDSLEETKTALFVYSKRGLPFADHSRELRQIDIVPTIALLLGVPIPFSSIGSIIENLFTERQLSIALKLNCLQLLRYASGVAKHDSSVQEKLRHIVRIHEQSDDSLSSNLETIRSVQTLVRSSLASFRPDLLAMGLLSMFEAVLFNVHLSVDGRSRITFTHWVFRTALLLLQCSLITSQTSNSDLIVFASLSLLLSIINNLLSLVFHSLSSSLLSFKHKSPILLVAFSSVVLCSLPFSNSYIIYESDVLRFFVQFFLMILGLSTIYKKRYFAIYGGRSRTKALFNFRTIKLIYREHSVFLRLLAFSMVLVRFSKQFEVCREEQVECTNNRADKFFVHFEDDIEIPLAILSIFTLNWFLQKSLYESRMDGSNKTLITQALSWPLVLLVTLHWMFDKSASSDSGRDQQNYGRIGRWFAQMVYSIWIVHLTVTSFRTPSQFLAKEKFQITSIVMMMVIGLELAPVFALVVVTFIVVKMLYRTTIDDSDVILPFMAHLLGSLAFYLFGHNMTLNSIPWKAAFVGVPGNFPIIYIPATLVLINLYAGKLLASSVCIIEQKSCNEHKVPTPEYDKNRTKTCFLLFSAVKVFGSMLVCTLHRKHLMFHKVFATAFIFEAVGLSVCCIFFLIFSHK